jgi:hypothetical protein
MKDEELQRLFGKFIKYFEIVFHYDWEYSKMMIDDVKENHTFINPGIEDESEDWHARGQLLESYRELKKEMKAKNIEPDIGVFWKEHMNDDDKQEL